MNRAMRFSTLSFAMKLPLSAAALRIIAGTALSVSIASALPADTAFTHDATGNRTRADHGDGHGSANPAHTPDRSDRPSRRDGAF